MTAGEVSFARYAEVTVTVRGSNGKSDKEIRAIVDTGFNGALSLPPAVVTELDLPESTSTFSTVFGGQVIEFPAHDAVVVLAGEEHGVQALVAENPPLVGMTLLYGMELYIDVVDGGRVTIKRRPAEPIPAED